MNLKTFSAALQRKSFLNYNLQRYKIMYVVINNMMSIFMGEFNGLH